MTVNEYLKMTIEVNPAVLASVIEENKEVNYILLTDGIDKVTDTSEATITPYIPTTGEGLSGTAYMLPAGKYHAYCSLEVEGSWAEVDDVEGELIETTETHKIYEITLTGNAAIGWLAE